MVADSRQRFAILVMLFGGFLELGSSDLGIGFMLVALLIGVIGLAIELRSQGLERWLLHLLIR